MNNLRKGQSSFLLTYVPKCSGRGAVDKGSPGGGMQDAGGWAWTWTWTWLALASSKSLMR